jgi:hypothetical protein
MVTWNLYERRIGLSTNYGIVHDRVVAICATKDQALDELRRLSCKIDPRYFGTFDMPTYYISEDAIAIGLVSVP